MHPNSITCCDCACPLKHPKAVRCNPCAGRHRWADPDFRERVLGKIRQWHKDHPQTRKPKSAYYKPRPIRTGPHPNFVHGEGDTPEHRAWNQARQRCTNPKLRNYHRYGGRGIRMCSEWDRFEQFLADMGRRPSPQHSLDRIDRDGNYCPENCRWATIHEQANNTCTNRYVEFDGEMLTIAQWARKTGIQAGTLQFRLSHGWTPERALTTPPRKWK